MKDIVAVNFSLPGIDHVPYLSGQSVLDYDIILFDPQFPYLDRINFTGGGSCISIEGTRRLVTAMEHWKRELTEAIKAGKSIFFLLNDFYEDSGALGYTTGARGARTYNTAKITNYDVLPLNINVRNAKGKQLKVSDGKVKGLFEIIKDITEYRVVFTSEVRHKLLTTKDGSNVVSAVSRLKDESGRIVYLPYFSFSGMTFETARSGAKWNKDALRISKGLISQMVEIDKFLRSTAEGTPKPEWAQTAALPKKIDEINLAIQKYDEDIAAIQAAKELQLTSKENLLQYSALLYENGKPLEVAIERTLRLMGYTVENFQDDDREIDHIISYPGGIRMIGESEGKDTSAIDISKFRQLESNINEDFERESATTPAKGILFGNGYRLTQPAKRPEQFTQKCLTNAIRLRTALVRTSDLYDIAIYLLDHPKDEKFKKACRDALEKTEGTVVTFPTATTKKKASAGKSVRID